MAIQLIWSIPLLFQAADKAACGKNICMLPYVYCRGVGAGMGRVGWYSIRFLRLVAGGIGRSHRRGAGAETGTGAGAGRGAGAGTRAGTGTTGETGAKARTHKTIQLTPSPNKA